MRILNAVATRKITRLTLANVDMSLNSSESSRSEKSYRAGNIRPFIHAEWICSTPLFDVPRVYTMSFPLASNIHWIWLCVCVCVCVYT